MVTEPAVRARIGFHNDYFTVGQGPYDFYRPTHESWPRVLETAPTVVTDGEMPWDFHWGEVIPGVPAAKRLQSMHYSTFSVTHNIATTIKAWRATTISKQQLRKENLPVSDGYFRNSTGAPVERTVSAGLRVGDHNLPDGRRAAVDELRQIVAGSDFDEFATLPPFAAIETRTQLLSERVELKERYHRLRSQMSAVQDVTKEFISRSTFVV